MQRDCSYDLRSSNVASIHCPSSIKLRSLQKVNTEQSKKVAETEATTLIFL